jgi:argininosuccinate synthase
LILQTEAEYMSYGPDKLSMERVEDAPFLPEDRIGALEIQNISITDNRDLLVHHLSSVPRLRGATDELAGLLAPSKSGK